MTLFGLLMPPYNVYHGFKPISSPAECVAYEVAPEAYVLASARFSDGRIATNIPETSD